MDKYTIQVFCSSCGEHYEYEIERNSLYKFLSRQKCPNCNKVTLIKSNGNGYNSLNSKLIKQ